MASNRLKIYCNVCGRPTWHGLQTSHVQRTEHAGTQIEELAQIWACLGCETISFRISWTDGIVEVNSIYPPRKVHAVQAKKFVKLPSKLEGIYNEIIEAFDAGCYILSAGGLRALLEGICSDKGITHGSLNSRINGLVQWVPESVVRNLHGFRFLGNQALHQLDPPEQEDLGLAIEVIEDVMNAIYELDYKSGRLFQRLQEKKQRAAWDLEEGDNP